MQEAYFDALLKEMELVESEWEGVRFDTLFIGGGTPTSVKNEYLERTLNEASLRFDVRFEEATIEANPGTVDIDKLKFYLFMGIDRISFGVQSTHDDVLKAVGRIHTFFDAREGVELAHKAGFSNISVDLMSGLPGQGKEHLLSSVKQVAKMKVNHVSMYTLKLEEETPLYGEVKGGIIILPSKDSEYEMSKSAREKLNRLGYKRYEISNYAKPGFECAHNLHYWNNDDFLGLGLAAASAKSGYRTTNTRDIHEYISKINSGKIAYAEKAQSCAEEYAFETLMLGLRLTKGVDLGEYVARHGIDLMERFKAEISDLKKRGLIKLCEGRMHLTDEGMDVQNTVLVELMEGFDF
jgi:oxygen-independent coproporphyrinogen-3 oxidase